MVGPTPEREENAARALGIERALDSLGELLERSGVEVVHVLTPNALHADQASHVIDAGKHVIRKKTLAATSGDVRALAEKAPRLDRQSSARASRRSAPPV